MRWIRPLLALALLPAAASGAEPRRPVVVELFTSQGCSSCPPADAFLAELARDRPDVLPLAFHVTYWNGLGWQDPYALEAGTDRQRFYAAKLPPHMLYTPQMVVDGRQDVVGSERAAAASFIGEAAVDAASAATLDVARDASDVSIAVGAGQGRGTVWLIGYDPQHRTAVARGENGGRTLLEANIVRSLTAAATWSGVPLRLRVPSPAGERVAVIVQSDDGRILAAGRAAP